MLISSESRELRARVERRWASVRAWADDPTKVAAVAKFKKQLDDYYARWKSIDKGFMTDPDELHGACLDLDVLENAAVDACSGLDYKYFKTPEYGTCKSPEQLAVQPLIQAGQAAEDYCGTHPDSNMCRATTPKDEPGGAGVNACLRSVRLAGLPDFVCSDWFPYALGGAGLAVVGVIGFAVYKAAETAAPYALPVAASLYAPQALTAIQAVQAERARRALEEQ